MPQCQSGLAVTPAPLRRALATAAVLLGLAAATPARADCNVHLGWWEQPQLPPVFPDVPPEQTTDCDFQTWSWTAFAHFMQPDPNPKNGGVPLFLNLPTYDDLVPDKPPMTLLQAQALVHPRELVLEPRDNQPQSLGSFQQAGSKGVLVDQNGRSVYYITHMDPIYFAFTQKYFGPNNYKKASPTLNYPVGATVLKSSWRIVQPGEDVGNAYTTTATIALLEKIPRTPTSCGSAARCNPASRWRWSASMSSASSRITRNSSGRLSNISAMRRFCPPA